MTSQQLITAFRQGRAGNGLRFVQQYAGVIGASPRHCFFASHKLADDHGRVDPIK